MLDIKDIETNPYEMNLAEKLTEDELERVGADLLRQIKQDDDSRSEWMSTNKEWIKLATQVRETKSYPWENASNVKYPLLTVAAMQFNARALPNLINSSNPVRVRVLGKDEGQLKQKRAERVSKYMSYQVMEEMEDWLDEMDRLLFVLPMVGLCYKKSYYSELSGTTKSGLRLPNEVIVNYHAKDYNRARITEIIHMDSNEFLEMQLSGIYLDEDVTKNEIQHKNVNATDDVEKVKPPSDTSDDPYELYESHCWVDLDDDGYKEPYIITMTSSGQIVRITARYIETNVKYRTNGDVARIIGDNYFTPYIFIPDPSSAVYGLGLGTLLGPTNEAVNTILNQLIDAGTLANLQGGFLARGIKLKGGAVRLRPGEWKVVNTSSDDLRKGIFPAPIKEPSGVLFQLLGTLIESGQQISSVSEMMVGESPGQNQAATTTMAVLEQGLKVFTSIYKRIHRALAKEYRKLYLLNKEYFNSELYSTLLDEVKEDGTPFGIEDFEVDLKDIMPASDPSIVSQAQRSVKSQSLLEKLGAGLPLNVGEVTRRTLEAEEHEDIDKLMDVPPPPQDPEIVLKQRQQQHTESMDKIRTQLDTLAAKVDAIAKITSAAVAEASIGDMKGKEALAKRQQDLSEVEVVLNALQAQMTTEQQSGQQAN